MGTRKYPKPSYSPFIYPPLKKGLGFDMKTQQKLYIFPPADDQKLLFAEPAFQSALIKIKPFLLDLESFYGPSSYVFGDQVAHRMMHLQVSHGASTFCAKGDSPS